MQRAECMWKRDRCLSIPFFPSLAFSFSLLNFVSVFGCDILENWRKALHAYFDISVCQGNLQSHGYLAIRFLFSKEKCIGFASIPFALCVILVRRFFLSVLFFFCLSCSWCCCYGSVCRFVLLFLLCVSSYGCARCRNVAPLHSSSHMSFCKLSFIMNENKMKVKVCDRWRKVEFRCKNGESENEGKKEQQ